MKQTTLSPSNRSWSRALVAAGLAMVICTSAGAQQAAADKKKAAAEGDERPDFVELNGFLGGSFFQQVDKGLGTKLNNGGAAGARVTENFWRYVGLEQAFTYSTNNLTFLKPNQPGLPNYGFGSRIYQYSLNPVVYWTPRGSRFRPFMTVGISALNITPTDTGKADGRSLANQIYGAQNTNNNIQPAMNYGGGLKVHLTDRVGLRFDVRGLYTKNPTYRLPDSSSTGVYIPRGSMLNGVQTTAGITYYIGKKAEPLPPPAPPPPPQPLAALNAGTLSAGSGTLCQGRAITVRSNVTDPAGRAITYKWTVNGQPAGSNSAELTFTPDKPGSYMVELQADAPNTEGLAVRTAKANTLSLNVQEYKAPTIGTISVNPAAIEYGQSAALSTTATGSACSTISYQWTATEGTISNPTGASTSFDSKSVRFDQGGKIQSKTVTITGKVTDDRGQSATATGTLKVDYTPQSIRFSDVIFSKGSSRVNNCGKRVLLEELAPKAADPDYEIVLVGHIDNDEASKTRVPSKLDQQRALNALAVLTGGTGTCANVDPSRVKVDWVGTEQVADMQPALCGTSARSASKERPGSMASTADQNRRVEVWLVPKGTKMPSSFKGAKTVTPRELKRLGCPK